MIMLKCFSRCPGPLRVCWGLSDRRVCRICRCLIQDPVRHPTELLQDSVLEALLQDELGLAPVVESMPFADLPAASASSMSQDSDLTDRDKLLLTLQAWVCGFLDTVEAIQYLNQPICRDPKVGFASVVAVTSKGLNEIDADGPDDERKFDLDKTRLLGPKEKNSVAIRFVHWDAAVGDAGRGIFESFRGRMVPVQYLRTRVYKNIWCCFGFFIELIIISY